ncbi:MAG: hypothetical protein HYZ54_02020 [Ignavibacteriae bacterium]|nr:hypothetical protein [Ignavibacteriota bacterium]
MAQRKNVYYVQISSKKAPSGLSVVDTLRALEQLIEKYVRKHKGHPLTKPYLPEVTISLTSGKEITGALKLVSEKSAEIHPTRVLWVLRGMRGNEERKGPDHNTISVADLSFVVGVEYRFNAKRVDPNDLK